MKKFLIMLLIFFVPLIANANSGANIINAINSSASYHETEAIINKYADYIGYDKNTYDSLNSEQKEDVMREIANNEFGSIDDLRNKINELVNRSDNNEAECVMEVSLEKTDLCYEGTVNVYNMPDSALLGIAGYYGGKLISFEIKELTDDTEAFNVYRDTDNVKIMLWSSASEMKPLCKAQSFKVYEAAFLELCNSQEGHRGIYEALVSDLYIYPHHNEIMMLPNEDKEKIAHMMWSMCREYETCEKFSELCTEAYHVILSEQNTSQGVSRPGGGFGGGGGGASNTVESAGMIRT